jgi:LysM repeat protein
MTAERSERRYVKIRRRGRHTAPSQVEKMAGKAGKAAPAMAIAGALVATPHAQHAATAAAKPKAAAAAAATVLAAHRSTTAAVALDTVTAQKAVAENTHYTVRQGDTLSEIAEHFYDNSSDWQWLYHENDTTVSDPNLIYPGQKLFIPVDPPEHFTLSGYTPRHAKPAALAVSTSTSNGGSGGSSTAAPQSAQSAQSAGQGSGSSTTATTAGANSGISVALSGTLGCSGLEQLWTDAGGAPDEAFMAAEIAMAESSGDQYALSPTDDYGYWQINISNGSLATFNAYGNARAAITLSDDGTNWAPWTTYTSGAYSGRC